jgi:dihydrofolate reductase
MRRIVMFNRVSADGYFSDATGNLDWALPDDELEQAGVEGMQESDTILFGRRTYEAFEGFWRHALDASDQVSDPHAPGRSNPRLGAMAKWINQAHKLVWSRTLSQVTWHNARVSRDFEPREVEALKRQPGGSIMLFGSASIASLLTQHQLVDEYQFIITPILLGSGKNLIRELPERLRLKLREAKSTAAGNVRLRYTPE